MRPNFASIISFSKTIYCYLSCHLGKPVLLLTGLCVSFECAAIEMEPLESNQKGLLFTLEGSNTIGARLAPAWAEAYLKAKGVNGVFVEALAAENEYRVKGRSGVSSVYIDIRAHGSSTGFTGLKASTADIAMSSRAIKSQEVTELKALGNMQDFNAEHVVAIDGLAIIVHPSNALKSLSVDQIAQIFSGKVDNWKALGGPDMAITLYARDDNSGTYDTFESLVLQKPYTLSPRAARFESNDVLSEQVARSRGGIGFVGLASINSAKALAITTSGALSLMPEHIFVATEDYPLSRRLYMYAPLSQVSEQVVEFIEFAQGQSGQDIVEQIGFVSQNPKSMPVALEDGPAEYRFLAKHGERLSLNFRFRPGQADLDNKALQDVQRLANYMKSYQGNGVRLQLVGFSNVESTGRRARVLSRLRATAVKAALYRYGVRTEVVMGFGDDLRIVHAEDSAALKNERVEAWIIAPEYASKLHSKIFGNMVESSESDKNQLVTN